MEGDAIELGVLALIVFIFIAIYLWWRGINNGPIGWLEQLLKWLEQEFSKALDWLKNLPNMNDSGSGGQFSPFGKTQGNTTDLNVYDPNTLYQIPDATSYNNGLLPLMWYDATGSGTDTTDPGSGVGVSINGGPTFFSPSGGS